jgi:hypothetical protein
MKGRTSLAKLAENWAFVLIGNLLGALFVAWFTCPVEGSSPLLSWIDPVDSQRAGAGAHGDPMLIFGRRVPYLSRGRRVRAGPAVPISTQRWRPRSSRPVA